MTRTSRQPRGRARSPLAILLTSGLVLVALVSFAVVALRAPRGLPLASDRTVFAEVPDIGNIRRYNEVRIAGVRVGKVVGRSVAGSRGRLELRIDGSVGPLPVDTAIAIRGRGLLGQRYVELIPGRRAQLLADRGTIRGSESTLTAGVPDVLDTFDAQTRQGFGDTIGELGNGLLSRGENVNDALLAGPDVGDSFLRFTRTLFAREGALARLTPSLDALMTAAAPASDDIARGFAPAARALTPFLAERSAVRAALGEAPSSLAAAAPALRDGRRLVAAAGDLARASRRVLAAAPSGLAATSTLLGAAPQPLGATRKLLAATRPVVAPVLRLGRQTQPVLEPAARALSTATAPVETLGRYGCDIDNFAENWRDFLAYAVPGGGKFGPLAAIRIDLITGPGNISGAGPLAQKVLAPDALVDRDPYPRPCRFSPGPAYTLGGGAGR